MVEAQYGELAAPFKSDTDATEKGHEFVAAILATLEAVVGISPHTVRGLHAFRFPEYIIKIDLKFTIKYI